MADDHQPRQSLRIGSRGSPLALAQAHMVRDAVAVAFPDVEQLEIVPVETSGDRVQDRPLREIGGKGLFTKELDVALAEGRIDIAVHSMKDVETLLPEAIVIDCMLAREDPRDALFVGPGLDARAGIAGLPNGCRVGTSSLRRAAQARALRPDIEIVGLRGNVETRLQKLARGDAQATLLAVAGLNRLGRAADIPHILEINEMLPAVGQGAVGVARREGDMDIAAMLSQLDDPPTRACVDCRARHAGGSRRIVQYADRRLCADRRGAALA